MKFFLLLSLLLITFSVNAKIYKWKDENGKWQMSDVPPRHLLKKEVTEVKVKDNTYSGNSVKNEPVENNGKNDNLEELSPYDMSDSTKVCSRAAKNYKRYIPELFGSLHRGVDKSKQQNRANLDKIGRVTYEVSKSDFIDEFSRQCKSEWGKYSQVMTCMATANDKNTFVGCAMQLQGLPGMPGMPNSQ